MAKKSAPVKAKKAPTKAAKPEKVAKPAKVKEVKVKAEKPPKAPKAEKPPKAAKPEKTPQSIQEAADAKIAKKAEVKKVKAEAAAFKAATEDAAKWMEYKTKHGGDKAPNYSMSGVFEAHTPVQHKVLGWGYILSKQNDRLEVIFEQGTKVLISNYKPS